MYNKMYYIERAVSVLDMYIVLMCTLSVLYAWMRATGHLHSDRTSDMSLGLL